jgi:hypothetical protein
MLNNISMAHAGAPSCAWLDGNISTTTEIYGNRLPSRQSHDHAHGITKETVEMQLAQISQNGSASPPQFPGPGFQSGSALAQPARQQQQQQLQPDPDAGDRPAEVGSSGQLAALPPGIDVYSLDFGFVSGLLQLPDDAPDKHLQIANVTLLRLPQQQGVSIGSSSATARRLLQQSAAGRATPPGIWTILLWPIKRCAQSGQLQSMPQSRATCRVQSSLGTSLALVGVALC